MAKSIAVRGPGRLISINGQIIKRAQNLNIGGDLNPTRILEMGNSNIVEIKEDLPRVPISFELFDIGSIEAIKLIADGDPTGDITSATEYQYSGQVYSGSYSGAFTFRMGVSGQTNDLDSNKLPEILVKVSEHNDLNLDRTAACQGAFLMSIAGAYDVGGYARETFNFETDFKRWYANALKDAKFYIGTPTPGGKTFEVPITKGADEVLISAFVNREEYSSSVASWTGTTVTITDVNLENLVATDRCTLLYAKGDETVTGSFPKLNPTNTGTRGALRRGCIVIQIYKTGETASRLFRCQSASYTINLGRNEEFQMGTQRYIDRPVVYPLDIKWDFKINDSDLETYAKLQGKTLATLTSADIKEFSTDITMVVKIYNHEYTHDDSTTLVKTITSTRCRVATDAGQATPGATPGTQDMSLQTDNITWVSTNNAI